MGLAIYGILVCLKRNLVAERKQICIQNVNSDFFFFFMWAKDKFTQPGKICKELKIVLVGFFLFSDYRRTRRVRQNTEGNKWSKNEATYFFPSCSYPEDINFVKYRTPSE